jgi:ATP-binding cassette subfamily F protein uup
VVSHDRDFLDLTVSRIIAFEGNGVIDGCGGGYSDYVAHRKKHSSRQDKQAPVSTAAPARQATGEPPRAEKKGKLTYKLQYELENLPARIAALEKEIGEMEDTLSDMDLFSRDRNVFDATSKRLAAARAERDSAERRWLELEEMKAAQDA